MSNDEVGEVVAGCQADLIVLAIHTNLWTVKSGMSEWSTQGVSAIPSVLIHGPVTRSLRRPTKDTKCTIARSTTTTMVSLSPNPPKEGVGLAS